MKSKLVILLLASGLVLTIALPVTQNKKEEKKEEVEDPHAPSSPENTLEYERYLKEVVEALESDPEFRKKLDKAPEADIRSGKISQELEYVNHHVRSKLDEIKRREVERLRGLAKKEFELSNDIDRDHMKISQHLDHHNEHTFEIEDLRKLIKKTSEDLAEADRKRRAEFKEYEMQKEFERETQMKEMDEDHRKKFEQELKEQQEKHKNHEKVHHPGNKAQLEEVWEKQDHMDKDDFDPKTFFMLHDLDENGFWDEVEVKALFLKELDKVYQSGLPDQDVKEREEELERMREHVFKETDKNRDNLISFEEFIYQTKQPQFNQDPSWETVDQQKEYTHEEYLEFERRRQKEIQKMIDEGLLPPHPNMPQGYYPDGQQHPAGYQQPPPMHYQNPQQQVQQQQQQYQQQQQQYQQQQQLNYQQQQQQQYQYQQQQYQNQQPIQEVKLNPNQVYQVPQQQQQQIPQQQQQIPQQQQQQVPLQQQQVPQQPQQAPQQQQQPPLQPQAANSNAQQNQNIPNKI